MKRALKILLFIGFCSAFAQENTNQAYSLYFTEKSVIQLKRVSVLPSNYYHKFQPKATEKNQVRIAAGEYLIVDASGIYLQKNKLLFITREQVREDSRYEVRNGYLFGVIENDSILTALDGENYYFLLPSKTYLFDVKMGDVNLFEGAAPGEFVMTSFEDNGHYTALYLKFKTGGLELMEPVLSKDNCSFTNVKEQEVIKGDFDTYIFSPTLKEWQSLFACFTTYDDYVLVE